jgi:cardiolipin synthase A/B
MRLSLLMLLSVSACAPDAAPDLCEQAARHREACMGDYVTPPECTADAEASAQALLVMSCEELTHAQALGKADGAFCDWMGLGCTPDEPIFTGAACRSDSDCRGGAWCAEKHCFGGVASADFASMMDKYTASRESSGSSSHLLTDNQEVRDLRNQLIASAEHSIHFTALLIQDDDSGFEMAGELAAAARRGVEVRVIVDATTQYDFSSYRVFDEMKSAGVHILPYNPVFKWAALRFKVNISANQRLHEKLLIADGTHAVLGGRNVGDDYLVPGKWRDTDVYLTGPGVHDVQRMFLSIWDELASWELLGGCPQELYCPPPHQALAADARFYPTLPVMGTARTRAIYSNPRNQKTPRGYLTLLNLVRSARRSIEIANSYFVPPRRLRKHLKAAVARGVKVTVLTNSKESTDAWWMYYASLNYYEELIKAGIEIRQYRGTETMHAKTMLVDDTVAVVGSYNLDPRSATSNSESLVLIRDGAAVGELKRAFQIDSAFSDAASYSISAGEWVKAKAFRLTEPLL